MTGASMSLPARWDPVKLPQFSHFLVFFLRQVKAVENNPEVVLLVYFML